MLSGTRMRSTERCYLQWLWVNQTMKGAWSGSVTWPFINFWAPVLSFERMKLGTLNLACRLIMRVLIYAWLITTKPGVFRVMCHVYIFGNVTIHRKILRDRHISTLMEHREEIMWSLNGPINAQYQRLYKGHFGCLKCKSTYLLYLRNGGDLKFGR